MLTSSSVNPLYYVTFTTATLCASFILFRGFNTTDPINTISLLCGFLVIFSGVYLLNLSRTDPDGLDALRGDTATDAIPTDAIAGFTTRRSMQLRRSIDLENQRHRRIGSGHLGGHHRRSSSGSLGMGLGDREGLLLRDYEGDGRHADRGVVNGAATHSPATAAHAFGLDDLTEDSEEERAAERANGQKGESVETLKGDDGTATVVRTGTPARLSGSGRARHG